MKSVRMPGATIFLTYFTGAGTMSSSDTELVLFALRIQRMADPKNCDSVRVLSFMDSANTELYF